MYKRQAQDPQHVPAVPAIHPDDVIVFLIIRFRQLHGAMIAAPDAFLLQLGAGPVMDAVSDLLPAGGRGIDVEAVGEAAAVHQVLHNVLSHSAAADVAVANK